jgi:hypothetical protein
MPGLYNMPMFDTTAYNDYYYNSQNFRYPNYPEYNTESFVYMNQHSGGGGGAGGGEGGGGAGGGEDRYCIRVTTPARRRR